MMNSRTADPFTTRPSFGLLDLLSVCVILFAAVFLSWLASQRPLAGYGTETDFIGSMVSEAKRLLAGMPLESEFHPPGFIFTLAAVKSWVGDWFAAGKALSVVSAVATLVLAHLFFRIVAGTWAAFGAVLGLVSSATFLRFAVQATSDLFFLALYFLTYFLVAFAATRRSVSAWFLAGLCAVFTMMTRTNGVTLLVLLAIPLLMPGPGRWRAVSGYLAGTVAAAAGFLLYAGLTGSNLMPGGTYYNIALTYFTAERVSWEGMIEAQARFSSLYDVLTYDPAALAKGYARDLADIALRKIPFIAGPALALFFLPGLVFAGAERRQSLLLLFLAATLAQVLLVNLKAYEPRYHLYFVPWVGAGAMILLSVFAAHRDWSRLYRSAVLGLSCAVIAVGVLLAVRDARTFASWGGNPEMARVLAEVGGLLGPGDLIMSRKTHLAFYTGAESVYLPIVTTEPELRAAVETAAVTWPADRVYLFIGEVERSTRPETAALIDSGLSWLDPVAKDPRAEGWTLYRYAPGDASRSGSK